MAKKEFWKGALAGALTAALFLTAAGTGAWLGYRGQDGMLSDIRVTAKFAALEKLIHENYLGEIKEEDLEEGVYTGLLYGLGDPYSVYYTAEEYEKETMTTEGTYEGIGVAIQQMEDGSLRIVECYEGSSAMEAGVLEGDILKKVDEEEVAGRELSEVVQMIRGKREGSVQLTVYRESIGETLQLDVSVTDVILPSVSGEMLDEETGYIRITEFKGVTCEQYKAVFQTLDEAGMTRLIIDLRDNPGGLLTAVCDTLQEILPKGIIVYTEDKNGNRQEITCEGTKPLSIPLAVLVNGGSASASEIFAGAVQDYDMGTIVGTITYGKGIVQSIHVLQDGSAVKLTVSQYFTPKGRSIHKVGITPDVEVEQDGSLAGKQDISHEEDTQLKAAWDLLKQEGQ